MKSKRSTICRRAWEIARERYPTILDLHDGRMNRRLLAVAFRWAWLEAKGASS